MVERADKFENGYIEVHRWWFNICDVLVALEIGLLCDEAHWLTYMYSNCNAVVCSVYHFVCLFWRLFDVAFILKT